MPRGHARAATERWELKCENGHLRPQTQSRYQGDSRLWPQSEADPVSC